MLMVLPLEVDADSTTFVLSQTEYTVNDSVTATITFRDKFGNPIPNVLESNIVFAFTDSANGEVINVDAPAFLQPQSDSTGILEAKFTYSSKLI